MDKTVKQKLNYAKKHWRTHLLVKLRVNGLPMQITCMHTLAGNYNKGGEDHTQKSKGTAWDDFKLQATIQARVDAQAGAGPDVATVVPRLRSHAPPNLRRYVMW